MHTLPNGKAKQEKEQATGGGAGTTAKCRSTTMGPHCGPSLGHAVERGQRQGAGARNSTVSCKQPPVLVWIAHAEAASLSSAPTS